MQKAKIIRENLQKKKDFNQLLTKILVIKYMWFKNHIKNKKQINLFLVLE